jgi:hypothetical protein
MICGSDGILAKPTNDNGKIANGSPVKYRVARGVDALILLLRCWHDDAVASSLAAR